MIDRVNMTAPRSSCTILGPVLGDAAATIVLQKLSLRFRLALFVAGATLPLIVSFAAVIFLNYEGSRRSMSERMLGLARLMMHAVEICRLGA